MKQTLVLSFLLLLPTSSAWSLTTETFTGEVFFGPAIGETGFGSFTYDETLLTGVGEEFLYPTDGLLLDFTFVGKTFFETDDTDFDLFPELIFFDGVPVELDYLVVDGDGVGTEIDDPRMDGFFLSFLEPDGIGGFFTEIFTFYEEIPEPTTISLAGLGLSLLTMRRRR